MNLIEFISYLQNPSEIEGAILKLSPDLDVDFADIYLEEDLSIYSNLHFFNAEEIEGKIEIEHEGKQYVNLFPLDYLQDIFDSFNEQGKDHYEIANDILSFRIKDA